ncbi:MAG: hypothetical protein LBP43_00360 [Treponema sp.]|jgi:hypothetical protein|nr:hypothetical protein [Treponema sp.]
MQRSIFRSPEEWKSALMTLPDNAYFELMRSIFGNIKTPFNKQRIMEELVSLLTREEIRKTIAAYIDERDHRIIAATALLEEPVPADLEYFFAGEFSAAEIRLMLLNLEERFLIYRFRDNGVYRLALNPILEKILLPFIEDREVLFASVPAKTAEGETKGKAPAAPDDRLLAAFFAFIPEQGDFFKAEGGLRKKIFDTGQILFPGLPLESLIGGLQNLGLLRTDRERLFPDIRRLRAFGELSRRERLEYCALGIYTYRYEAESPAASGGIPGFFRRSYLRNLGSFIHRFLDLLDPRRCYPKSTLQRFVMLLERGEPAPGPGESAGPRYHFTGLLEALEQMGLLTAIAPDLWQTGAVFADPPPGPAVSGEAAPGEKAPRETPLPERPALAMDTAFTFFLYPEIAFADALTLAGFCSVRETGAVVRFELTRQSVVRGFNQGLTAAAMADLINRLSGNRMDKNVRWTLQDWENRYAAVSLYHGVVLTLAEDRRYLAETEPLASLVSRTLAPGIYLLSVQEKSQAAEILEKAGVDIVAQYNGWPDPEDGETGPGPALFFVPAGVPPASPFRGNSGEAGGIPAGLSPAEEKKSPEIQPDGAGAEDYKERFRGVLKKMDLPKLEREELAARIERRLVVSETQLAGASIRYEKLEARGLDYVGKAAIAKQAIASKSLLEVLWPHPGGGTNKALGIPEALEKQGGESVLILKPFSPEGNFPENPLPEERSRTESIRLPLGKISLLRRIKQSIFGE